MKPLYTDLEFLSAKSRDKLPLRCYQCNQTFLKGKNEIQRSINGQSQHCSKFCSAKCVGKSTELKKIVICNQCNKQFIKMLSQIKSVNNFCNRSCATYYRNAHKTKGYRVSKLELFLQTKLVERYPTLLFDFNQSNTINSELDIYIPSLKLAFELNGIFHYEPIYGQETLTQIQNNDNRKFQACLEKGIELCIIDSSSMKNFTENNAFIYLNIVISIIDLKIGCSAKDLRPDFRVKTLRSSVELTTAKKPRKA